MPASEFRSIETFVQTAELGSMSKAATAMQITPQAASKALGQLEQRLGVRLFHRTTRSMSLTEEGQRFFDAVQPSLAGLRQAFQSVRQSKDDLVGPLRIVGPRTVLQTVIGLVLDEYCRLYPDVQPDVQLDDHIGNWVQERMDVGFRLGNAPQDGLIARRLFTMQLIICASPVYLRKHGIPRSLYELGRHRCSGFRHPKDGHVVPWSVRVGDNIQDQFIQAAFSTNDESFELRAVLAGEVIGQLAAPTVASHIRAGRLIPLLPEHMSDTHGLYLYYGSRTAQPARVRHFIDLVGERLAQSKEFMLSRDELAAAAAQGVAMLAAEVAG